MLGTKILIRNVILCRGGNGVVGHMGGVKQPHVRILHTGPGVPAPVDLEAPV